MALPYENATSGRAAIDDMQKILRRFGAQSFGCMEDMEHGEVIVQFRHRDRTVIIKASIAGYTAAWLKEHPYTHSRMRKTLAEHQANARKQAQISVYSILRDWVKGQITAVEIGVLSFEGAFLGALLLGNGETVLERINRTRVLQLEGQSDAAPQS